MRIVDVGGGGYMYVANDKYAVRVEVEDQDALCIRVTFGPSHDDLLRMLREKQITVEELIQIRDTICAAHGGARALLDHAFERRIAQSRERIMLGVKEYSSE